MRFAGAAGVCFLLAGSTSGAGFDRLRNVEPGDPLPEFNCKTLDGRAISSGDIAGKVLVLVYLKSGQMQSEQAVAAVDRIVDRIGSKSLHLVYFTPGPASEKTRQLRVRLPAGVPLVVDEKREFFGRLGMIVYPTTVISTRDGRLAHVLSSWARSAEFKLDLYCRHALGEIDDSELQRQMTPEPVVKDGARARANRHRAVAKVLRARGLTDTALRELELALGADPTCDDAAVELAELLLTLGRLDEARQRIDPILKSQPKHRAARLALGVIALEQGRLDDAERILVDLLALNPDPRMVHYQLGRLYECKGEHEPAMNHYRQAVERFLNEPRK
jgi:tetratricopeptide (TPR) repeat protein